MTEFCWVSMSQPFFNSFSPIVPIFMVASACNIIYFYTILYMKKSCVCDHNMMSIDWGKLVLAWYYYYSCSMLIGTSFIWSQTHDYFLEEENVVLICFLCILVSISLFFLTFHSHLSYTWNPARIKYIYPYLLNQNSRTNVNNQSWFVYRPGHNWFKYK
jgi:hypothetical protein